MRRSVRRGLAGLLLVAVAASGAPPVALANGDPASDILPLRDSYLPFQPRVPRPVEVALDGFLAKARKAGYPVKVAVIATPNDLGVVPDLFAKPKEYATFLGREISFNGKPHLLIVMPGSTQLRSTLVLAAPCSWAQSHLPATPGRIWISGREAVSTTGIRDEHRRVR